MKGVYLIKEIEFIKMWEAYKKLRLRIIRQLWIIFLLKKTDKGDYDEFEKLSNARFEIMVFSASLILLHMEFKSMFLFPNTRKTTLTRIF